MRHAEAAERVTLSAALIVRNEQRTVGRCLESIRDAVDEIVVVDTGSADLTMEIARQFTDCIHRFHWRRDFAAARRFSFEQASGDWVFWLDADDVVHHADKIRPAVHAARAGIDGFAWKYVVGRDSHDNPTCELWRERCVRNRGAFRWVGRVHEVLIPSRLARVERRPDVVVVHHPDPDRQVDARRNLEILLEEYRRRRRPEPRALLYLGRESADLGELHQAVGFLGRFVQISTWDEEKYLAQVQIAHLYRVQQQYERALDADRRALRIMPHWPHAYFSLAETHYFLRDWPAVIHWVESGRARSIPNTACISSPMDLSYRWIIFYTTALYYVGRLQEALEWTDQALALCPSERWHLENRRLFGDVAGSSSIHSPRPDSEVFRHEHCDGGHQAEPRML